MLPCQNVSTIDPNTVNYIFSNVNHIGHSTFETQMSTVQNTLDMRLKTLLNVAQFSSQLYHSWQGHSFLL